MSKSKNHNFTGTQEEYLEDMSFTRPHIVILGAGASLASFPNGDKNGKKLPLMDNLIEDARLYEVLGNEYLGKNIEDVFTLLSKDKSKEGVLRQTEERIFSYFEDYELPDEPTLYDHLVLSLREKDIIASFNWDPFLYKAVQRNAHVTKPPKIIFLHGNVAIGYCENCPQFGERGCMCSKCGKKYTDSKLLYPTGDKDYNENKLIKSAWNVLKTHLKNAYMLTIFGYRAPNSDHRALNIFKESWGSSAERSLEEIELIHRPNINKESVEAFSEPWRELIHTHHYETLESIYDSQIMKYPRRSCESFWSMVMNLRIYPEQKLPKNKSLLELHEWFHNIIKYENTSAQG